MKFTRIISSLIAILMIGSCLTLTGCSKKNQAPNGIQFELPQKDSEIVVLNTEAGVIKLQLFPQAAPKAVENFLGLVKKGYYDGVGFHRIIQDFMIQGGDPEGTGMGGESIWGKDFAEELDRNLFHFTGALAMAKTSQPNSQSSQFYIVKGSAVDPSLVSQMKDSGWPKWAIEKYKEVGGTPHLDFGYTVFGQLIEGMDVVNTIIAGEVTDENGTAKSPVKITTAAVEKYQG